jgi:hypothetical protein
MNSVYQSFLAFAYPFMEIKVKQEEHKKRLRKEWQESANYPHPGT